MRHWSTLNRPGVGQKFEGSGDFHDYFSNFVYSPIEIDGVVWTSVEHFFQGMKTLDVGEREEVREQKNPGAAKIVGRSVTLRPDWDDVKFDLMLTGLRAKFSLPEFRESLVEFEGPIVEWNTWHDRVWGVCVCQKCRGTGQNLLGQALEQVRDELRSTA
jgi:ribA/ribD-fused uncharacterized protein